MKPFLAGWSARSHPGVIFDELRRLIERHLQEHGIVVWFDPEQYYEADLEKIRP